jgi:hypothetical protein
MNSACSMTRLIFSGRFALGVVTLILAASFLTGCASLRPSRPIPAEQQTGLFVAPAFQPTQAVTQPAAVSTTLTANCTNDLKFLEDLTIPDNLNLPPGTVIDKEWKVRNTGTCNWGEGYTVQLITGPDLGANSPQALVPARNGSEAVVRITITAPLEPGGYESQWRAFSPDGQPFGEWFSVAILVTSP